MWLPLLRWNFVQVGLNLVCGLYVGKVIIKVRVVIVMVHDAVVVIVFIVGGVRHEGVGALWAAAKDLFMLLEVVHLGRLPLADVVILTILIVGVN